MSEYVQLPTPPDLDVVSSLQFSNVDNQLSVASWDQSLLLYDVTNTPRLLNTFKSETPILSINYALNSNVTYLGGLDGSIRHIDYENMKISNDNATRTSSEGISQGINNLKNIKNKDNLIVATSFDGKIQYIDTRIYKPVHTKTLDDKIFKIDTTSLNTVIGMANRKIEVYDIRNWDQPFQIRESGLKYQIRDLKCFPNEQGYALSSIDGRVSMEYFDNAPEVQAQKFAFKCHRQSNKQTKEDMVYPVNSLLFHPTGNTLFTAGSDGYVCLWNLERRRRMKQYQNLQQPVTFLDLNYNNQLLALSTSDDNFKNKMDLATKLPSKPSKIWLKLVSASECLAKK